MIAIIDGCGTNIASIQFACQRLGQETVITSDAKVIQAASHVLLPGVGSAGHAMQQLHDKQIPAVIAKLKQPVLGICLGMQLLFEHSSEGDVPCLGIIPGKIEALADPKQTNLRIPHMGWNQIQLIQIIQTVQTANGTESQASPAINFAISQQLQSNNTLQQTNTDIPLLANIRNHSYFYFIHSYAAKVGHHTLATCDYGTQFSAIVQYRNFYGVQFHPERSGKAGELILQNFFNLK